MPVFHTRLAFIVAMPALLVCRLDSACQWRRVQGTVSVLSRNDSCSSQGSQGTRSHREACSQRRCQPAGLCRRRGKFCGKTAAESEASIWTTADDSFWFVLLYLCTFLALAYLCLRNIYTYILVVCFGHLFSWSVYLIYPGLSSSVAIHSDHGSLTD